MRYKDYKYNDNYIVYDNGKIFSKKRGIFLKSCSDNKGYQVVALTINGKQTTKRVHRIIAEHFISNPEGKPQVNHIDKNKANNDVSNLEWVTNSENMIHALKDKPRITTKYRKKRDYKYNYKEKRRTVEKYIIQSHNKYYVNINNTYLGMCNTLEEARKKKEDYLSKGGDK